LPEGLLPALEEETVAPPVEPGAERPRLFDQIREPLVAPREEPLQEAHPGVVPLEADVAVRQAALEKSLRRQRFLETDLPDPLEGRVRLGDQRGEPHVDLPPPALLHDAVGQVGDALEILFALAGQADHEVELDGLPPAREDAPGRLEEVRLGVALVDDVAQPLRPGLGGDGEARLAHPADFLDEPRGQGLDAKRRQPQGDPPAAVAVHQRAQQRLDPRVVAGAERQQRDLVVARRPEGLLGHREQRGGVALPHRPPDHPRLAEPASPGASPGDLEGDAVVDRVHEGDDGPQRVVPPVEIGDDALAHPAALPVQGRDVEALQGGEALESLRAPQPLLPGPQEDPGDLGDHLLPLADDEGIEEGGHGERVERTGPAGDHDRVAIAPVLRPPGHPPEVEHRQDVRVGQLVLQGEADEVKGPERRAGFERPERQPMLPQPRLHVRPGGVDALGADVRAGVQDGVEDLQAQVGHAHLVGVRKGQGDAQAAGGAVLVRGVGLAAGVAARLFDEGQEGLEQMPIRSVAGHVHRSLIPHNPGTSTGSSRCPGASRGRTAGGNAPSTGRAERPS